MCNTKTCNVCSIELPISSFYYRKESRKYRDNCKKCKPLLSKQKIKDVASSDKKVCKHCNLEKYKSEYNKAGKWHNSYCKLCDATRKKEYYIKNKEKVNKSCKNYYITNKEKVTSKVKEYLNSNKELVLSKKRDYYNKNKEKLSEKAKNITEEQKIKNRERAKSYKIKNRKLLNEKLVLRSKNDINFRLLKSIRSRVRFALISKNSSKLNNTENLLGCSIQFFKNYLEERFLDGMTWDNYGLKGWHIDHKIPCSMFDLTNEDEQKKCFNYTNQQPLWALDNLKKGAKIMYL